MVIPSIFYPFLIKSYTLYTKINNEVNKIIDKIYIAYDSFFTHNIYAFYRGYFQPVLYKGDNSKAIPTLFFDTDTMLFYPSIAQHDKTKQKYSLPILSLEIIDLSDNVIYDLTDFIEQIRYIDYNAGAKPSLSSIVMIWATITNTFPDTLNHRVRYIDSVGDVYEKWLTDTAELAKP